MSYSIHPASGIGRLGEGFGRGLSEQLPKEIERSRLASGLQNLSSMQENDPIQQMAYISSLPGMTPQMIQTFGELLRNRARGQAFQKGIDQTKRLESTGAARATDQGMSRQGSPYEEPKQGEDSITTRAPLEAVLKPPRPKNAAEIMQRAAELMQQNQAAFNYNPQEAIQFARQEVADEQAQYQTALAQRSGERDVQQNIKNLLSERKVILGAKIPGIVEAKIIDKATRAVLPKSQGGEGLTEEAAAKKYGKEYDEISRDYNDIRGMGSPTFVLGKGSNKQTIENLRKKFSKRGELKEFADSMVSENGISFPKAYSLAYKISKEGKDIFKDIPSSGGTATVKLPSKENLVSLAKKSLNILKKDSSQNPLSFYWELMDRNYSPEDVQPFWEYIIDHSEELNEDQQRALSKKTSGKSLNDIWGGI